MGPPWTRRGSRNTSGIPGARWHLDQSPIRGKGLPDVVDDGPQEDLRWPEKCIEECRLYEEESATAKVSPEGRDFVLAHPRLPLAAISLEQEEDGGVLQLRLVEGGDESALQLRIDVGDVAHVPSETREGHVPVPHAIYAKLAEVHKPPKASPADGIQDDGGPVSPGPGYVLQAQQLGSGIPTVRDRRGGARHLWPGRVDVGHDKAIGGSHADLVW